MASTSIGSTGVVFPDSTTQATAAVNPAANVTSATAVAGTGISVTGVTTTGAATHTITNTGVTSVTGAGTVSVSGSTGAITITGTGGSGTVTSVATGNGLQGGTITTTGTLSIACPTFNTVGSYVMASSRGNGSSTGNLNSGSNYAAGTGFAQMQSGSFNPINTGCGIPAYPITFTNNLSGTWKWMGGTAQLGIGGIDYNGQALGLACRVS
jgi:hypothetical protein